MKIAVIGYSGSGKSTLARSLGVRYGISVLHFDTVQFLPCWEIRQEAEKARITKAFLDAHDSWVIDGNYSKLSFARRMEEADVIVMLLFCRVSCLLRVTRRFLRYRNTTRPDMADGCREKLDWEFVKWVLWKGRSKETRERFRELRTRYSHKILVIKNQWQLNRAHKYIEEMRRKESL